MFKKLKDKIAEEVKQSPLKSVQQLAQAVVSPSSSSVFEPTSSNDKFCIEEGDIEEDEKHEPAKPGGFTSVTLTGQTTSPIRDQSQKYGFRSSSGSLMAEADNLFPKFEPQPTNFHVQSDWESASEVEDRYSQLEHINKESLYEAYRKVYNRYNRMKNKYHEVVTHYRQLEREKEKAKTVLTETQDKALLRISELREQCLLEQQAKAHLEEALRNELEERDHIINTLRTKVQYLKGVSDNSATESMDGSHVSREEGNLIDFTENSSVSIVPLPFDASNSEEKFKWFEEKLKTLKNLINAETLKFECMRNKLKEAREQEDKNVEKRDSSDIFEPEQETEKELTRTLSDIIVRLSTNVQNLQKNAVNLALLSCSNDESNLEMKLAEDGNKDSKNVFHLQSDEVNSYTASIKQLEEQTNILTKRLQEESFSAKELRNELNSLSTATDLLKKKIKLSNENFGKNDAINCLITDVENELINEWNLCFQNFLQTRCEVTVLKDTRADLEKELLRVKEENNKSEKMIKEVMEKNNKLKRDIESLQKDLENNLAQLESLSKERSDLKFSNENLEKQIKKLEETLKLSEKVTCEKQENIEQIIEEKIIADSKLSALESELQTTRSEYTLLLEVKEKLDLEVSCLRKEIGDMITEKELLNNKVNEMEDKLKEVEYDYNKILHTRDGLENQINSLTKDIDQLTSEKGVLISKISILEKDLEINNQNTSSLLEEKNKLLEEMGHIKEKCEKINEEKNKITNKFHDLVNELDKNKQNYSKSEKIVQHNLEELLSVKRERDELTTQNFELESKIDNFKKEIEKLKTNCDETVEVKENLLSEVLSLKEDRDKLSSEIQSFEFRIVELDSALKTANENLLLTRKENADLVTEKNNMQEEMQRLDDCLKSNIENNSLSSEINIKLSKDFDLLKKERDDLIKEKSTVESQSKKLEHELSINKEEMLKLSEEYNKICDKLHVLEKEHEELVSEKQSEHGTMDKIKNDLIDREDKLKAFSELNKQLSDEIDTLKNEYKSLQDRYNNVIAEYKNNKDLTESLTKDKIHLCDELDSLKKDFQSTSDILAQTKAQLQKEQNTISEFKDEVHSLSESLKEKYYETEEKNTENVGLRTEVKSLKEKINVLDSMMEKSNKERDVIQKFLFDNLNNIKTIKELQKGLYSFVKQIQVDILQEISDINSKMGDKLLKHLNDLLDPETCKTKSIEMEFKSKKENDSYNSKLKNFQEQSNISEEIVQVKATDLESPLLFHNELQSNVVKFRQLGHLEKSSELDCCSSYDQHFYDPETYLRQAISLMKSFTNLLNHNSVNNHYSEDLFEPSNDKYIKINEIEGKNLQKEIVAMESFIIECETRYSESKPLRSKLQESDNVTDPITNVDALEMRLRQEMKCKDDIIKKLESVIEKFENEKGGDDSAFIYKQRVSMLEQENQSLLQKLQQLKETNESNVKRLISEYEKKLEELEEEKNLFDFNEIDKEKKHAVNEMKEQIQNLQQDLEERGDAFEKLYEEHQQSVKSLDEEILQLKSNHDKELREQDKKWRQCLDRRLAEEEARHQQELTSLNMQWNAERRELETARRLAVNAVESGSGSNELLRRQVQALTVQLAELRNSRCEACDHKRKSSREQGNPARSIQDCTEMEYLRNILYEYMMGKEPLVLAKVLCALVKFDENQTKEIVSKEEHRITLFGQLGLL